MNISNLVVSLILLPVISAVLVIYIKKQILREFLIFALSICGTATCIAIVYLYYKNGIFIENFNYLQFTNNINFTLQVEPFTLLFASLISILWPLTLVYTINYMNTYKNVNYTLNLKTFYVFLCLSISATLGIAFSGNLITTFVFYECLTFLTYPLIIFEKTKEAEKAGKKYLTILLGTSMALFLPAIVLVYVYTDSTNYTLKGLFFASNSFLTSIMFLMFLFGVSKAALFPVHGWLPAAMVAPSPVSAILHAVAVVKSGVFVLIKVTIYIFGINHLSASVQEAFGFNIYLLIPAITILITSTMNLFQNNLKKLLAYSTISNLSYIMCCVLSFSVIGVIAASAWFVAHALAKIVLFFQTGCYIKFAKKDNIIELAGIGTKYKLPIITTIGAFSMLSILNLPFTLGFISKFYLIKTILLSEAYYLLIIISISYVFTIIYFSKALYHFYFSPSLQQLDGTLIKETKIDDTLNFMILIMIIITMINVLLFFTYDYIIGITKSVILEIS